MITSYCITLALSLSLHWNQKSINPIPPSMHSIVNNPELYFWLCFNILYIALLLLTRSVHFIYVLKRTYIIQNVTRGLQYAHTAIRIFSIDSRTHARISLITRTTIERQNNRRPDRAQLVPNRWTLLIQTNPFETICFKTTRGYPSALGRCYAWP